MKAMSTSWIGEFNLTDTALIIVRAGSAERSSSKRRSSLSSKLRRLFELAAWRSQVRVTATPTTYDTETLSPPIGLDDRPKGTWQCARIRQIIHTVRFDILR
jgi:hypothetical protein